MEGKFAVRASVCTAASLQSSSGYVEVHSCLSSSPNGSDCNLCRSPGVRTQVCCACMPTELTQVMC
jgi:hypothetical protein